MLFKLILSLGITLLSASLAFAQCNRCEESDCGCQSTGGAYEFVVDEGAGCADGSRSCGHSQDWNHPFFDCCRKNIFNFEVCDPCCNKPYFSLFGGATGIENFHRTTQISAAPFVEELQGARLVDGYGLGAAIGYRVHPLLRLEAEYSYRFNRVGNWFTGTETDGLLTSSVSEAATGRVYSHAGMFNAVFDASQRRVRCFNLYGGGGIGVLTVNAVATTATNTYVSDDSQFAYQFIGGVNYPVSERVELFTEYRYLGADGLDVVDQTAGTSFGDFDYDSHNIFFGLRFNR